MNMLAQQATGGVDWNQFLNGDVFPGVVISAITALIIVIWVVVVQWRRVRIAEADVGLKLRMLERGYSADEIAKVLDAGIPTRFRKRRDRLAAGRGCSTSDFVRGGVCP